MKSIAIVCVTLLALTFLVSCEKTTKPNDPMIIYVTPDDGLYSDAREIMLSCSIPDAEIRYTTNGTEPTAASQLYTPPLCIQDILPSMTNVGNIKVKAFKSDHLPSQTVSRYYHVDYLRTVPSPVISPTIGTFDSGTTFTISCSDPEAEIHYILSGNYPDIMSPIYHQPIVITQSGAVSLRAKAFRQNWNPSPNVTQSCVISYIAPEMAFVQGGSFHNGTSDISLSSFYMDKHEVTQADYIDVMHSTPLIIWQAKGNYPVYYVSWQEAIEYCNRRSALEGLDPCYGWQDTSDREEDPNYHDFVSCYWAANGYRLPTEMEWMFAAQGGTLSQGYEYSGADSINYNSVLWYDLNSGFSVHPVAQKLPNELGIFDMSGNLWEWCWDLFAPYPEEAQTNPHGVWSGTNCVIRGGSYSSPLETCAVSFRSSAEPNNNQSASIGFRCVRRAE
ncbi:MAG: SUMF1/EgtB/PvdO family nonheme iron enzyme [Candidatus Cloacimonetes bacterium]|nr:SUMF1/EgtB/PvdO family nonheme iron enzyme [Candidatus Cloacimonadota bacterium]